ncbi:hypothetical protein WA026_004450 [Henosepilachna vigintioctopunctata]|uniref:Uncharacterized protein n=1 Tax=Henosepilachna vigintioctopunctata TaxID=420089 RepID=A0AAW1VBA4_9CUCU
MKKMMAERHYRDESTNGKQRSSSVIDGNFLGMVFGTALVVIVTVSVYAFYNLYIAILKKFPSQHDEL